VIDLADMRRDLERLIRLEEKAIADAIGRRDWYRQALEVVGGLLKPGPTDAASKPGPKPAARAAELEQLRPALLAAIQEHGPHGAGALAVVTNSHKRVVKNELARMAREGLVHGAGVKRHHKWHLGTAPATP